MKLRWEKHVGKLCRSNVSVHAQMHAWIQNACKYASLLESLSICHANMQIYMQCTQVNVDPMCIRECARAWEFECSVTMQVCRVNAWRQVNISFAKKCGSYEMCKWVKQTCKYFMSMHKAEYARWQREFVCKVCKHVTWKWRHVKKMCKLLHHYVHPLLLVTQVMEAYSLSPNTS